jgi:hypothetical protein
VKTLEAQIEDRKTKIKQPKITDFVMTKGSSLHRAGNEAAFKKASIGIACDSDPDAPAGLCGVCAASESGDSDEQAARGSDPQAAVHR